MAKVEITSSGITGRDTRLVIDGVDISRHCDGLTLEMPVGKKAKLNVSVVVRDLDLDLTNVDVTYTPSEVSKKIQAWLKAKDIAKAVNG